MLLLVRQETVRIMANPVNIERLRMNLAEVRSNIAEACRRAGRDSGEIRLVAVTKYSSLDTVRALPAEGVLDLGENRVQQLAERADLLGTTDLDLSEPTTAPPPRWHMIGHLQRNKVKGLLKHTRVIHSLDSTRLVAEVEKQAQNLDVAVDAFLEINVAGEAAKSGAPLSDVRELAQAAAKCSRLRVQGLMTMAPFDTDPEAARPHFARLRELLDSLRDEGILGPECRHLSMGMTIDYTVAIEEGATFLRIGSALFKGVEST